MTFLCKSANPESIPPNHLLYQDLTPGPLSTCPNHLRIRHQSHPYTLEPMKLSKLTNPKPAYTALPCLPHGDHNKGSHIFPYFPRSPSASWPTLVLPHVALHGVPGLLFLGICDYKPLPHDSHLHVCMSYYTCWEQISSTLKMPQHQPAIGCGLPWRMGVTLGKAAPCGNSQRGLELQAVSSQHSWQLEEWTSQCRKRHLGYASQRPLQRDLLKMEEGLPHWYNGWESTCQCREHGLDPWSGKIPHAAEQLSPCTTTTEPAL